MDPSLNPLEISDPVLRQQLAAGLRAKADAIRRGQNPLALMDSGKLWIQDKRADLIVLKPNRGQQIILDIIRSKEAAKEKIRIIVLKGRQGGVSTVTEGAIYCRTSQQANRHALIMADEEKKASHLYGMEQRFHENIKKREPALVPDLERSNERGLKFAGIDSHVVIGSAENPDVARAFTWNDAHLSEVAFYPPNRSQKFFDGFWPSMSKESNTMVVIESTANGQDPVFWPMWNAAEAGQSDFVPVFLPWFITEEYQLPLAGGQMYPLDRVNFDTEGGLDDFLEEERFLRTEFRLTDEQLNWRRWCIVNECSGEVSTFRQEYPSTSKEAFQVSGACIFRAATLRVQRADAERNAPQVGRLFELNGTVEFRPDRTGWLELYEPARGQQVRIGGDTCEGLAWGEQAGLVALEARSRAVLAVISGPIPPDQLAKYGALLGHYYKHRQLGEPMIAIEANNHGHTANHVLKTLYANIYSTIEYDPDTREEQRRLGFLTTGPSRDSLIEKGKAAIRENSAPLRSLKLINQLSTFVKNKKSGKVDHAPNCFSDLVFAWMIAVWLCDKYPAEDIRRNTEASGYIEASEDVPQNYGIAW